MKYIIFWTMWLSHSIECPDYKKGDMWHCAVAHIKTEPKDTSVFFYSRTSALSFFDDKIKEYHKQELSFSNGDGTYSIGMLHGFGSIDNIKIDSVKN